LKSILQEKRRTLAAGYPSNEILEQALHYGVEVPSAQMLICQAELLMIGKKLARR
jgi:hypothetical protein